MSNNIAGIAKRLVILERSTESEIDPLEIAFDKLTDDELDVIQEYISLVHTGYSQEEIAEMMSAEVYAQALGIVERVDEELRKQGEPQPRKRGRKAKKTTKSISCDEY